MNSMATSKSYLRWGSLVVGIIIGMGLWQVTPAQTTYLHAWLTNGLLHTAWVRMQNSGEQVKPWPWAETWPIARLVMPANSIEKMVLADASKNSLPFTLGHLNSSAIPGEQGNSILTVHRESYLDFLSTLKPGDTLLLESLRNGHWRYTVAGIYVVEKDDIRILEPTMNRRLTFVSCYPCTKLNDANALRYVVIAEAEQPDGKRLLTNSPPLGMLTSF